MDDHTCDNSVMPGSRLGSPYHFVVSHPRLLDCYAVLRVYEVSWFRTYDLLSRTPYLWRFSYARFTSPLSLPLRGFTPKTLGLLRSFEDLWSHNPSGFEPTIFRVGHHTCDNSVVPGSRLGSPSRPLKKKKKKNLETRGLFVPPVPA